MSTAVVAVETTQWIIALGSLGSALIALALALGLKDWSSAPVFVSCSGAHGIRRKAAIAS